MFYLTIDVYLHTKQIRKNNKFYLHIIYYYYYAVRTTLRIYI